MTYPSPKFISDISAANCHLRSASDWAHLAYFAAAKQQDDAEGYAKLMRSAVADYADSQGLVLVDKAEHLAWSAFIAAVRDEAGYLDALAVLQSFQAEAADMIPAKAKQVAA